MSKACAKDFTATVRVGFPRLIKAACLPAGRGDRSRRSGRLIDYFPLGCFNICIIYTLCGMKKMHKVFLLVVALVVVAGGIYLYLIRDLLNAGPRAPRLQVPVTYRVAWWPYQGSMFIDAFNVEVVESKLSIFNSESLIAYTVKGNFASPVGRWYSDITEVHISERIINDTTLHYDRIIEITPIVTNTKMASTDRRGVLDDFMFTNEILINSAHSGVNRIMFVCGERQRIVELTQDK